MQFCKFCQAQEQAKQDTGSFHQFLTNVTEQLTVFCCKHVNTDLGSTSKLDYVWQSKKAILYRNTCFKKDYSCEGEAIPALPEFWHNSGPRRQLADEEVETVWSRAFTGQQAEE